MLHALDMSQVADQGEVQDEGPYLVRVAEVKETADDGSPLVSDAGAPKVIFRLKIQDEGKWLGTSVPIHASLQPHALFNLKAIYSAAGYRPGAEGHDPSQVLDAEFYIYLKQKDYDDPNTGTKRKVVDIPTWGIKSLADGPAKPRSK